MNSNRLNAMTIIPLINPYIDKWCSPYSRAAGNNLSNDINTIIPATAAKIIPKIKLSMKGINTIHVITAPKGSARPERKEYLNAFI